MFEDTQAHHPLPALNSGLAALAVVGLSLLSWALPIWIGVTLCAIF